MKRKIGTGILAVLMLAALAVPALAVDGPSDPGIYLLTHESSCSLSFYTKDADTTDSTKAITEGTDQFYANAEKIKVVADAQNDKFYLIIAQNDTQVPTEGNIEYIDQTTGTSNTATFTVYPKNLVSGTTYYIYLSSSADAMGSGRTPIASFEYYAPYKLGDVDDNGTVNANDALMALQIAGELITPTASQVAAADVDKSGVVNASDALSILQYAGDLITEWPSGTE